jgi:DNA polymerase elongation subunit (family B)
MGKVYKYNVKSHTIKDYPTRRDICSKYKEIDLTQGEEFIFMPVDCTVAYGRYLYGQKVEGYTLIISGTLKNFQRVQLIISEIDLYFDIRVSDRNNRLEIKEIQALLKGDETKLELVKAYPGIGFNKDMVTYLRIHFSNLFTRRKHLMAFQEKQFDTASDLEMYQMLNNIINRNEWSIADWSIVNNYEAKWVEKYQCWAVYITETNEDGSSSFSAVNRPLSADPPKCKVPAIPPYLSLGYDIEVNGKSHALPTPANIQETVFMLCVGIYSSDQTEPLYTATITNQTYIEDVYKEKNPDYDLILCPAGDNNVILAFADILGKFYPEYRLAFNSHGFDDPFICERINQSHYRQFDLFANMALPMPYAHIFPEKRKPIDTLFVETKIKLDGVFDLGGVKKRIHLPGTVNIDMMSALKKMNPKDDMLASHGLRSYLERYNLPNKLDISVADMNFAYENEDAELMYETSNYCIVDSISCNRLEQKVSLIASYHATAHLALCSISDAFIRAGGMKVKNVIYCIGRRLQCNYTENPKKIPYTGKFPGAVVFAPEKGLYNDQPTIALDFASLYPSIMRALWISSETYLDSPEKAKELKAEGYDVFPFKLNWINPVKDEATNTVIENVIDKKVYYVRKHPDGENCRGVYPTCLEFLGTTRKLYKKKMAAAGKKIAKLQHKRKDLDEEDPDLEEEMKEAIIEEKSYNQKQLATKVIMNTLYGALGQKTFNLYNVYLASTITLFGQKAIKASSTIAEERGYKRLYGDTDSIFLLPSLKEFEGMTEPRQKVTHCQGLAEALLVDIRTEIQRITRRDTNVIDGS